MASNITTLVEKAKLGDADAFSTLYQMYYPKMKGICINILRERTRLSLMTLSKMLLYLRLFR